MKISKSAKSIRRVGYLHPHSYPQNLKPVLGAVYVATVEQAKPHKNQNFLFLRSVYRLVKAENIPTHLRIEVTHFLVI